ncbi:MAG: pyridoxal phosphate-dependent aminotransferase [Candidatus Moranbacteria bacterium]|nr:pyridoxal phosphate-dependent aminotransferase [Candidatus Moranbacteria bacterium]
MRTNIVHEGADELTYEIRGIVRVAERLRDLGVDIVWENIGDPVAKGEHVPDWIKDIVAETMRDDASFGYSPTKGVLSARKFIVAERLRESGVTLDPDDILFFNGLGDAISNVYTYLRRSARVIGPCPAYPTHSSAEAAHAGAPHITYTLDHRKNWYPNLEDIRNKVRYNPLVAGILIINPDNPTGMVYPKQVLKEIVSIAREYGLFLVSDETYARLSYGREKMTPLYEVIGSDVPAIVMRGLSKEVPWPGSRCGWIEVYNKDRDPAFARYAKTLVDAKMLEVCSTTLPQLALPSIVGDSRFAEHVRLRTEGYRRKADIARVVFSRIPRVIAPCPESSFYYSVVFEDGVLGGDQSLPISDPTIRDFIGREVEGVAPDKRFVLYLMAATGVCVVPLSGFNTDLTGFRMTLLEPDEKKFKDTVERIATAIRAYTGNS